LRLSDRDKGNTIEKAVKYTLAFFSRRPWRNMGLNSKEFKSITYDLKT
jgi:hypothetical protein